MNTENAREMSPSNFMNRGIPATILLSYFLLAQQPDLRLAVPEMVAAAAVITALLAAALYLGEGHRITWSPAMILAVAAVARLLFLFRPPELSDDIFRYLWDGLNFLAGRNPYGVAPALQPVAGELAGLQRLVNHPELVTIYPPAAQFIFAFGAFLGGGVTGVKVILVLVDLASCFLILRILAAFRLPPWRGALYAWHPLPVLEIAASGHIDVAGIFFVLATICLLAGLPGTAREETPSARASLPDHFPQLITAGVAFVCAVLVKLLPLVFLPGFLLVLRRKRFPFLTGIALGGVAFSLLFLPDLINAVSTLRTYAENWEFAGFAFRTFRRVTGSGESARMTLAFLFLGALFYRYGRLAAAQRRTAPPAGDSGLYDCIRAFYGVAICFLLLTPTLHPWYALYLAAFLPFAPGPAGFVLSWSVLLGYRVLIPYTLLGRWLEDDLTIALITLAPLTAIFACAVLRRTGRASC